MKKKNLIILILPTILLFGCTKQTDDILGVWKLTNLEINYSDIYTDGSDNYSYNFDGSLLTLIENGETETHSFSETLTINADGTCNIEVIMDGKTSSSTNYWYYLDSDKDKKSVYINYSIEDFDDGELSSCVINELSNKNLVLEQNLTANENYSVSDSENWTYTKKRTYEKQ